MMAGITLANFPEHWAAEMKRNAKLTPHLEGLAADPNRISLLATALANCVAARLGTTSLPAVSSATAAAGTALLTPVKVLQPTSACSDILLDDNFKPLPS